MPFAPDNARRLAWVDAAKGLCILLVVMFHSTLGVEKALGHTTALNAFIEWARPFRMPDFFLISGLFLAARINRPWATYFDTKVVHFAYFYVLWVHILLAVKAPSIIGDAGLASFIQTYAWSAIDPFGSLWFIYLLAVYFVVAKLLNALPRMLVLAGAAALHVAWPESAIFLLDEFASRFVFFYAGYALSGPIFRFAEEVARTPALLIAPALAAWALFNHGAVVSGLAHLRGPDLAISALGIAAVITFSVVLVRLGWAAPLTACGRNSIVIYLAFTLFMGPARQFLIKLGAGLPGEAIALASMAAGVAGSLILARLVSGTRFGFLFTRPAAFQLAPQASHNRSGYSSVNA